MWQETFLSKTLAVTKLLFTSGDPQLSESQQRVDKVLLVSCLAARYGTPTYRPQDQETLELPQHRAMRWWGAVLRAFCVLQCRGHSTLTLVPTESKHRHTSQPRRVWFGLPLPLIIPILSSTLGACQYPQCTSFFFFTIKIPWNPFISKYLSNLQRNCGVIQWITECLSSVYPIFKNHFCSVCLVMISFPFLPYALSPYLHFIIISASSKSRLHVPTPFLSHSRGSIHTVRRGIILFSKCFYHKL